MNNLLRISIMIAFVTIISKFAGFFRDVLIAKSFGTTLVSDAYFYASQFPSLAIVLLGGLGGPFHTATVAVFTKLIPDLSKKPDKDVQKAFNSFVTYTGLFFFVLAILFFVFSGQIIDIIAHGATPELKALASTDLKIMSPIIFIGGIIGIFYGISNVYREFFFTSLSPMVLSIVVIIALLLCPIDANGYVLVWATLMGAIGQFVLQLPVFLKAGFRFIPTFVFNKQNAKKIGEILFPAMLGTTIGQINIYVDMFFTSNLQEGAWTSVVYANRVFQFPVGVLITAMLVPLFPMFSDFVGKQKFEDLKKYFHEGLNSLWFLAFLLTAFFLFFSTDIVSLLFERGQFDANATLLVSEALFFISLSMIPYMARDTLTRVFYAFDDSKTPFFIAICSVFVKIIMNFLLVQKMGVGGIMLSTTAVTIFNMTLLAILIRKKISLDFNKFFTPVLKMFICTIIALVTAIILNYAWNEYVHIQNNLINLGLKLSIIFTIMTGVYTIIAIKLKLEVVNLVYERLMKKLGLNK